MKMKRGKFSTFLFSLIPGAGEMYLGFFKFGTSLMSLFIGSIICASMFFSPLILITFVVWFYSFFHTNNINHLSDHEFEKLEDTYLFSPFNHNSFSDFVHNNKTLCSIVCIFIGVMILCYTFIDIFLLMVPDEFYYQISHIFNSFFPRIFFGIICILLGFIFIRGKKLSLLQEFEKEVEAFDSAETYSEWEKNIMPEPDFFQHTKAETDSSLEKEEQLRDHREV